MLLQNLLIYFAQMLHVISYCLNYVLNWLFLLHWLAGPVVGERDIYYLL